MAFRLNILGRFQFTVGSTEVPVGASKHVALLSSLAASAPLPQSRDRLTELLWGERFEAQARQSLRQAVSKIRRNLGQHSIALRAGAYFLSDQIVTDYSEFMSLSVSSPTEELVRATNLWRGELLEGLSILACRRAQDPSRAFHRCVGASLAQLPCRRRFRGGGAHSRARRADGALRDDLRCIAIESYAAAGRRAEAMRHYQDFSRLLRDELGAAPVPQTVDLVAGVFENRFDLSQDQSRPPPSGLRNVLFQSATATPEDSGRGLAEGRTRSDAVSGLPAEATKFIGRRQLTSIVVDRVRQVPLMAITGPGGVGKTRLARRVAAEVAHGFPDGVTWIPLVDVREARLVVPTIAAGLGRGSCGDLSIEAVIRHCTGKKMLVVLDNFEQVAGAANDMELLLSRAPGLHLLVTRRPLRRR